MITPQREGSIVCVYIYIIYIINLYIEIFYTIKVQTLACIYMHIYIHSSIYALNFFIQAYISARVCVLWYNKNI